MLEKSKLIVNTTLCWAWLATHDLNGPVVLLSCAALNLGDISLSCYWSYATVMGFMASKSDTIQLAHLRHGLLACLHSAVFKDLMYMINHMDSSTIMEIYNCTYNYHHRSCTCNYSQIALEFTSLPIQIWMTKYG